MVTFQTDQKVELTDAAKAEFRKAFKLFSTHFEDRGYDRLGTVVLNQLEME